MKYILVFLITLSIVVCFPNQYTKEERIKKRKELQQKMIECILGGDISESLKSKVAEIKEEKYFKIFHLFTNKLGESDLKVVRKCRREMIMNMRSIYGGRFGRFYNYSRIHEHFQNHYPHGNGTFVHRHWGSNSSSHHFYYSDPLRSRHHEFNTSHSHSFDSVHSEMHHSNFTHTHSSNSAHSQIHNSNSTQSHPSGSLSHLHSSNATQQ